MDVQQILERLGGGGNHSTAGAQLRGVTVEATLEKLKTAIDNYLEYNRENQ